MGLPFIREFRLAGPEGDGRHAYLNDSGAFLGDGTSLIEKDEAGRWRPRERDDLEKLLGEGYGIEIDLASRMSRLESVANSLNKSDRSLALIALANVELPTLPDRGAERMAKLDCELRKYDPGQPRAPEGTSSGGQWVSAGASAGVAGGGAIATGARAAPGVAAAVGAAARTALTAVETWAPRILPLLAETTAAGLAVPLAFAGAFLYAPRSGAISEGKLENEPDVSYRFDEGQLKIYDDVPAGETLFDASAGEDGFYRTPEGTVIGRKISPTSFALNADAISILRAEKYRARKKERAGTQARADARERDEPEVCPRPVPDRAGGRSISSLEYEGHIHGVTNPGPGQLAVGEAVRLVNPGTGRHVYYDDCRRITNTLIDAKGPSYGRLLTRESKFMQMMVSWDLLKRARPQVAASGGREIEWHFAEKDAADFVRDLFAKKKVDITVVHTPLPR